MNREIKFRGLSIDNKQWVYGYLSYFFNDKEKAMIMPNCYFGTRDFGDEDNNGNPIISNEIALGGFISVLPETVGQFTGLKDKNGVDIYEGDILSCPFMDKMETSKGVKTKYFNLPVTFENGAFNFKIGKTKLNQFRFYPLIEDCEIIGNIHENPELLK